MIVNFLILFTCATYIAIIGIAIFINPRREDPCQTDIPDRL